MLTFVYGHSPQSTGHSIQSTVEKATPMCLPAMQATQKTQLNPKNVIFRQKTRSRISL